MQVFDRQSLKENESSDLGHPCPQLLPRPWLRRMRSGQRRRQLLMPPVEPLPPPRCLRPQTDPRLSCPRGLLSCIRPPRSPIPLVGWHRRAAPETSNPAAVQTTCGSGKWAAVFDLREQRSARDQQKEGSPSRAGFAPKYRHARARHPILRFRFGARR